MKMVVNTNENTDCGSRETSLRKLTAIVQLSDETKYEGGKFRVWYHG